MVYGVINFVINSLLGRSIDYSRILGPNFVLVLPRGLELQVARGKRSLPPGRQRLTLPEGHLRLTGWNGAVDQEAIRQVRLPVLGLGHRDGFSAPGQQAEQAYARQGT